LNARVPGGEATNLGVEAGPLRARVDGSGTLRIGFGEPDWLGPARLETPGLAAPVVSGSSGRVHLESGWVVGEVGALADEPVVVLRLAARDAASGFATGELATPAVAWRFDPGSRSEDGAPDGVRAFGHQYTEFALPVFSDAAMSRWRLLPFRPPVVMPLGLVAPDGRTLLLAPLNSFHEQVIVVPAGKEQAGDGVRAGWHGDIDRVEAGFATELAIIAGDGMRDCFARWARLLRSVSGVSAPVRDADVLGTRLSYWTDNGSAYWYRTEPGLDAASSVVATVDDLEARGVPVGAVQLDSWWYPHEVLRPFDTDEWEVPPTGMLLWEPRADVLPEGIEMLRERLDRRPLVLHCRHLSSQALYGEDLLMWVDGDRAHPQDAQLYERLLDQAVAWGAEVFEHDWLIECFLGVRELRAPGRAAAWQEGIDAGLSARDLHAQWCMASPADFAQVSRLHNVTSIRTSGDHGYLVGPELLWAWFLHTNVMARALGLWPYKDVFHSAPGSDTREVEALLAALSAGPVGIGDALGAADVELIARACRADGVLVRPDVPVAAIDRAAYEAPVWSGELLVGSAHTDHAADRWGYVVVCNVGSEPRRARTRIALTDLGEDRPASSAVAVFNWRERSVDVLPSDGAFDVELEPGDWDYRVVAPILGSGVAVIGDPGLYACSGDTRVADVVLDSDGEGLTVTVLGANERVGIVGWSQHPISARAWSPAAGLTDIACTNDVVSGVWELQLDIGPAGWARLHVR
jgi:hypothetical protein